MNKNPQNQNIQMHRTVIMWNVILCVYTLYSIYKSGVKYDFQIFYWDEICYYVRILSVVSVLQILQFCVRLNIYMIMIILTYRQVMCVDLVFSALDPVEWHVWILDRAALLHRGNTPESMIHLWTLLYEKHCLCNLSLNCNSFLWN